jgi:hypothetical protein
MIPSSALRSAWAVAVVAIGLSRTAAADPFAPLRTPGGEWRYTALRHDGRKLSPVNGPMVTVRVLRAHDLTIPDDFTIGFQVTFDAFLGTIESSAAGLDCFVCPGRLRAGQR